VADWTLAEVYACEGPAEGGCWADALSASEESRRERDSWRWRGRCRLESMVAEGRDGEDGRVVKVGWARTALVRCTEAAGASALRNLLG